MPTLYPYYYIKNSKVYGTGYPTTSSAMYNGKINLEIASIFYNNTNKAIKLNSVVTHFGMYNSSGSAKLIFSLLDKVNSPTSVTPKFISNEFTVPKTSNLIDNAKTIDVSGTITVPKYTYFIVGAKVVASNSAGYVSCARTNANDSYKRTQYYSQSLGSSLTTPDAINLVTTSDVWNNQIPYIQVNYEDYAVKPIPSKTSLTILQGSSETISISGYDNWKIGSYSSTYFTLTKSGNNLTIATKYFDSAINVTSAIILVGSTSTATATVNVTIKMPSFIKEPTDFTLKPTQTKSLAYKFTDNQTAIFSFDLPSGQDREGFSFTSTSVSVNAITRTDYTDWRGSAGSATRATVTIKHPENDEIKRTVTATIQHWASSDIKVVFNSGTIMLNKVNSRLYYTDNTTVSGKCSFSFSGISSITTNYDGNYIYLTADTQLSSFTLSPFLTNDCVVLGVNQSITIVSTKDFSILFPNTDTSQHYLPAFYNGSYTPSAQNPAKLRFLNYPLYFIFPTVFYDGTDQIIPTSANTDNWYLYVSLLNEYIQISTLIKPGTLIYPGSACPILLNTMDYNLTSIPQDPKIQVRFELYYNLGTEYLQVLNNTTHQPAEVYVNYYLLPFTSLYTNYDHTKTPVVSMQGSQIKMDSNLSTEFMNLGWAIKSINYAYSLGLGSNYITDTTPIDDDKKIIVPNFTSRQTSLSDSENKDAITTILTALSDFISKLNNECSRTFKSVRKEIAIGYPIMWDDSLSLLANGNTNPLITSSIKDTATASPYKEIFNIINNLQFLATYNITYISGSTTYNVTYSTGNDNIIYKG